MERHAGIHGEGLEPFAHQLGVELADLGPREGRPTRRDRDVPTHRSRRASASRPSADQARIAPDALAVAKRLGDRLAEGDARYPRPCDGSRYGGRPWPRPSMSIKRMAGQLLQHMVEKADAGLDVKRACAVESDASRKCRFRWSCARSWPCAWQHPLHGAGPLSAHTAPARLPAFSPDVPAPT